MTLDTYNFIRAADNFTLLEALKAGKLSLIDDVMILVFRQFRKNNSECDYTVVWTHLCQYLPAFNNLFGRERYLLLHQTHNLCGKMEKSIPKSEMKLVEKEFLYFVYEFPYQKSNQ